jgi:hypothetical protein
MTTWVNSTHEDYAAGAAPVEALGGEQAGVAEAGAVA